MQSSTSNGRAAAADPPRSRRTIAIRRLPLTLGILLIVGLAAAGLAYVAAQTGVAAFQGKLVNNLREPVNIGSCASKDCKDGGSFDVQRVDPGKSVVATFQTGSAVNPFVVSDLTSHRIGCLFLRFAKVPKTEQLILITRAQHC